MINTYRIETVRLVIRCYEPEDVHPFLDAVIRSAENIHPWMNWARDKHTLDDKIALIRKWRGDYDKGLVYVLGIFAKDGKTFIGSTSWSLNGDNAAEIGYWIDVEHSGKGYMTEAVKALTKVGMMVEGFERITIVCIPENIKSRSVPRRAGFTHEATLSKRGRDADGLMRDEEVWSMWPEDLEKKDMKSFSVKAYDFIGREIKFK
jgi:RimJ/RimL family protein N-acetyltransferase